MPDKLGKVVILLGSPGVGKTKITGALLHELDNATNVNKDILSQKITVEMPVIHKYFPQVMTAPKVEQDSLYEATLALASYNLRSGKPGRTAIVEGNFGKRLTAKMLEKHFGDLESYDFYLIHVTCSDIKLQYQRVIERNDPKDKAVAFNGKTIDITNQRNFIKYREMRKLEELSCIEIMSAYMQVITVDNITSSPSELAVEIAKLKRRIEGQHPSRPHSDTAEPVELNLNAAFFGEEPMPLGPRRRSLSFSGRTSSSSTPPYIKPTATAAINISPSKQPLTYVSRLPTFELGGGSSNKEKNSSRNTNVTTNQVSRSLDLRSSELSSSPPDKKSPFLSLYGRVKEPQPEAQLFDNDPSGRKSPRFEDQDGKPMTRRDSYLALKMRSTHV